MPAISVIIVNLNGEEYLGDCLDSLSAQTFRDFEVIVVDNGSTDSSLEMLKKDYPWVKLVVLGTNTGFSKGNNIGLEASSSSRYVATLNNDTIPDRDWLKELHEAAEKDAAVGMVASKILLGRTGRKIDSVGMLVYPDGMSRQMGRGETDTGRFDSVREVLFPSACAALYRREMIRETGFFDEDFVSYCEDADLGLRGRLAGWKAVLAPHAVVRHLYSRTGGAYSPFKAYHLERNHVWVLLKNFPLTSILSSPFYTIWRYFIQWYGIVTGRGSVARIAEGTSKPELVMIVLRAYSGALAGLPQMLKKRRAIWKYRRIPGKEYRRLLKKYRITAGELMLSD
jgi:GT2 family glycosyltransferase